jgi:ferredoxin-NADP reductase
VIATTRGPAGRPGDHEGRFDNAVIAAQLARWDRTPARAYVCGSTAFVEALAEGLMLAGVASRDIRAERFGGASAPVAE